MSSQIDVREEIATRLKQAREAAGYDSVEDFCNKNGLSLVKYRRHEDGSIILRASQAIHYCKLLNISLRWLMLGETNFTT